MHTWVVGRRQQETVLRSTDRFISIDAHRYLRGPYTAAGALVRHLLPDAAIRTPDLVHACELTLVSVAPETPALVPVSEAVIKSFEFPRDGNLPDWTLRLAHGVADFLLGYLGRTNAFPFEIAFEQMHEADPSDREFVAVLLRRADPDQLRLRIQTDSDAVGEPLKAALAAYATTISAVVAPPPIAPPDADDAFADIESTERETLARRYVDTDCTAGDPLLVRAYAACPPDARRQMHLDRVAALKQRAEPSLSLGAIPLHCERAGAGVEALEAASLHCLRMAYYDACLDLARRGRRMADPAIDREAYGHLTRHELFSLLLLDRLDEVEALCRECEATVDDPFVLSHCAYAMAIMHLRFFPLERRDLSAARTWTEKAIAYTAARPPSANRIVNLAFLHNTMALVETKEGRAAHAIGMLDAAIEFLRREAPDSFPIECGILYRNRALLNDRLGNIDAAVADLTTMLGYEFSEARGHLQLAILERRRGRLDEALARSNAAIAWSPPWAAAHHHRALVYGDLRRVDDALADYDRVLMLDPDHVDTFSDRATLLYQLGRFDESRADVERGLERRPDSARLLCLRGFHERRDGREADACRSFAAALQQKPPLPDRVAAAVRRWLAARPSAPRSAHASQV